MRPLKLAISLLLVPRLAARLVLMPLLFAVVALALQLWLVNLTPRTVVPASKIDDVNIARELVYHSSAPRPEIVICKWKSKSGGVEFPPGKACLVGPRDVAFVGVTDSSQSKKSFADPEFLERLNGNFEKIHFCRQDCARGAGITVSGSFDSPEINVDGITNLLLLSDSISPRTDTMHQTFELAGRKLLSLRGLEAPIVLTGLEHQIARLLSLVMLVICCVWLSLRAHRRVLEYFASGGSLLPLAASAGPSNLYSALWLISGIRLVSFFAVSAPMIFALGVSGMIPSVSGNELGSSSGSSSEQLAESLVWFIAVTSSLVLTTLCASIADLKRRLLTALLWRVIPLFLVGIGGAFWVLSLLDVIPSAVMLRNIILATPLLGLAPLVVSAIIPPPPILIVVHALLATSLSVIIARRNARWFAANLEEA